MELIKDTAIQTIEEMICQYITKNILFSGEGYPYSQDDSFLEKNIIDSTDVIELVAFLEKKFCIQIKDDDITPDNFDSVTRLAEYVKRKQLLAVYQAGWQTFMGVRIEVAPGVLVPREETELLGVTAVKVLTERGSGQRAIDMCCGSGNLACGVASAISDLRLWASDLTDSTVELAKCNVKSVGLSSRVVVAQGDLFAGLSELGLEGTIDMVLCNPPYISTSRLTKDRAYLLENEPREAFDGGSYGVSIYQRIIKEALPFLKPDGWLLFEIGVGQEKQLLHLFKRSNAYGEIQFANDIFGVPRVVLAQRKG